MILQALTEYYEDLVSEGLAAKIGWAPAKVTMVLYLNPDGEIVDVASLKTEETRGKKKTLVPRKMAVPLQGTRSSGIKPFFLCDNSSYLLGADAKGKPDRSLACFKSSAELHISLLENCSHPAAKAVVAFFRNYEPSMMEKQPVLFTNSEALMEGFMVFRYENEFVHEIPEIQEIWQNLCNSSDEKGQGICLVTGKKAPIAKLHPLIKGIKDAQSSGAALVSYNGDAFTSYNWEQGDNGRTGEYAAFAYGEALRYLISDEAHRHYLGNTLVLCWAAGAKKAYQSVFDNFLFGSTEAYTEDEILAVVKDICNGKPVLFEETMLDPDCTFYILGISPNAGRLSVRFFHKNSFGKLLGNVKAHYDRLEIQKPVYEKYEYLPVWALLKETENGNERTPKPKDILSGEVLQAVINDLPYPASLLNGVVLRIRAEKKITRGRAAIIKAYYLKKTNRDIPQEVLTVALNQESKNPAYNLGRLFAILEEIQENANPGINATIKDRYFNSASATPGVIIPILLNLSHKHLKKLSGGKAVYYNRMLQEVMGNFEDAFPQRLNLPQQGAFQLGYYHQEQYRYQPKQKQEEM